MIFCSSVIVRESFAFESNEYSRFRNALMKLNVIAIIIIAIINACTKKLYPAIFINTIINFDVINLQVFLFVFPIQIHEIHEQQSTTSERNSHESELFFIFYFGACR